MRERDCESWRNIQESAGKLVEVVCIELRKEYVGKIKE